MLIYPLYGKTVKELVEIYKEHGYKYSLYKSKKELINGLLLKLSFNEFKKRRLERLKEEVAKLREEHGIIEAVDTDEEGEVTEEVTEEVAEGELVEETTGAFSPSPSMNPSNPLLNPVCPEEELSSFIHGLRRKYILDTFIFNPFNDDLKCQQYFNYKE